MIGLLIYFSTFFNLYPIDPVSLRLLTDDSDVIAVVEVLETGKNPESNPKRDYRIPSHIATLKVKKIIKGGEISSQMNVGYSGNMLCPSPANFEVGELQLVFLVESDDDRYRSTALSYGTPHLEGKKLTAYIAAVEKRLVIMGIEDEKEHKAADRQWILDLTLDPLTRHEGILELNPERYLPTGSSKGKWSYSFNQFSLTQQNKLIEAVLGCADFDYEAQGFYKVVASSPDPRLTEWLKTRISKASGYFFQRHTGEWLLKLLERQENPEAREFLEEQWPKTESGSGRVYYYFSGTDEEELKAIADFLQLFDD